ncbi:hypothetical protein SAMN06295909_2537 [Plantibacter sp. VKM Ac-1784]|uniref:Uncharacterized protein n=1 Tax=Plantibacter elymi (nom. nud.) TaxID=199708 RepID=A0ABY1RE13_9MICO|nr:hypothetical protein [Plantibacter sp. VKM Ac-1784]SMQ72235.1 hypothetical protein SAMN06295909_2537 [Plantibacter sp. VKM Ac-1784]
MLTTEATMDELLVAEPVEAPSAGRNGVVSLVALVAILTIVVTAIAALFFPVVQGATAFFYFFLAAGGGMSGALAG